MSGKLDKEKEGLLMVFRNSLLLFGALLLQGMSTIVFAQDNSNDVWQSANGSFQVSYESQLKPIVINQMHSWTLHVTNAQGQAVTNADITVKGGMPAHNHGLATAPSIVEVGGGDYLLQGLRFHMMGYWEMVLL